MITIAFFNNKGGVGKTSLVYHLAWMYADLGISTVAVDIDRRQVRNQRRFDRDGLGFGLIRPILGMM